jgi:hypothetical protein
LSVDTAKHTAQRVKVTVIACMIEKVHLSAALQDEAALQQQHVVHASAMAALLQGLPPGGIAAAAAAGSAAAAAAAGAGDPLSLTLSLRVRRGHEMEDALRQIRSCGPQVSAVTVCMFVAAE